MNSSGLIGYSGYVGGTLLRARTFSHLYNSKNIADIAGMSFDILVCAGVSAEKWLANKEPDQDAARIEMLKEHLRRAVAREFVLISTIDVYPDASLSVDEDHVVDAASNHSYGRHRYELERWVADQFAVSRIVRLPALFGEGLKKNALFDLLNNNLVSNVNPSAVFQWYPTRRLAADLETLRAADVRLANLFTEPLRMREIVDAFFPNSPVGAARQPAPEYRLCTKHAALFAGRNGYISSAEAVLGEMARFIAAERHRTTLLPRGEQ
jgi:hypothetical protein